MKNSTISPLPPSVDSVFLALGQTVYMGQLLEATMLELIASANELLDGTGDGTKYQASIDTLSRQTLGQLLRGLHARTDMRPDVEELLGLGLEARNFVIHRFAKYAGDDLADQAKHLPHQRTLYEKCAAIMAANDTALAILHAISQLLSQQSMLRIAELEQTAVALRELATLPTKGTH